MTAREQPWRDDGPEHGRIVVLSRNPVAAAIEAIAGIVGREVTVIAEADGGPGLAGVGLAESDAVVLCDHDAPDAPLVLRLALASPAGYVAMLASRSRAGRVREELEGEGVDTTSLHVPAGLDTGGRSAGEIALSVVAEIVATGHGRTGGSLRD